MDPDTQEELREAFQAGAKNKPTLGLNELAKALMWLGQNPTPQELSQMLAAAGNTLMFKRSHLTIHNRWWYDIRSLL